MIWIYGGAGTGKTVLCTSIIEDLQQNLADRHNESLAYFFFDKNDQRKTSLLSVVTSAMAQLLGGLDSIPPIVTKTYETAVKYGRPHISLSDDPVGILRTLVGGLSNFYIVLDRLDEAKDIDNVLNEILGLTRDLCSTHLLCLSRDNANIRISMGKCATIKLDTTQTQEDMNKYLQSEITNLSIALDESNLLGSLFDRLRQGADGIFLLAFLAMQKIKSAVSPSEMIKFTNELPQGLAMLYASILKDLSGESPMIQQLAQKLFLWVCSSTRPLHWAELQYALALQPDNEELDHANKPFKTVVLRICSPLIEYQEEQDLFRPVHLSVCDFLFDSSVTLDDEESAFLASIRTSKLHAPVTLRRFA